MEYKQFFSDLEEDYPSTWNIQTFKSLKSFSQRIKYCNENLQRLSSGSSRVAYKIDEQKVLKLAKNKKGIAQNGVERDYYIHQQYEDVVANVFDIEENDLWIEMELAKKINPNRFNELVGVRVEEVGNYLLYQDAMNTGRKTFFGLSPEIKKQMDENEWVQQVYTLCREVDLSPGDFGRISSFGEVLRNGKPAVVIIDVGLSKTVFKDFYGVN
jgi:hypothetical protein